MAREFSKNATREEEDLIGVDLNNIKLTKKGLNLIPQGKLGDLAPTILKLLGEVPPVEMDGNSIIID